MALGLIQKGETVLDKVWGDNSSSGGGGGSIDKSDTDGLTTTGSGSSSVGGWGIPVGK